MSVKNLARTFVQLADTLVADFDPVDFMTLLAARCVDTLGVDASGVLLADHHGELQVVGASSEQARLLELFEVQHRMGPCMECFLTQAPVTVSRFDEGEQRWPEFAAMAASAGFGAVHALPMRLRSQTVGALNLFSVEPRELTEATVAVAQAMADIATIGLLQARFINRGEVLVEELQRALHSRVLIEQAKGVLAERLHIEVGDAFEAIRRYARSNRMFISAVAEAIVTGTLTTDALTGSPEAACTGETHSATGGPPSTG